MDLHMHVYVCVCAHAPHTDMHGEMMAPEFRVPAVPVPGTQVLSLQHYYRCARHSPLWTSHRAKVLSVGIHRAPVASRLGYRRLWHLWLRHPELK